MRDVEGFFVVPAWRTLQLDLRTPALYQMGSFKCHCPMTKQCLINLGTRAPRIKPGAAGCKARTLSIVLCGPSIESLFIDTTKGGQMTFGQMARNSWNKSCPCPPFQLSKMTPSVDGRSNATVFDKSVSLQQKSKKPKFKVGFKH